MKITHIRGRHSTDIQNLEKLCEAQRSLGHDVSISSRYFGFVSYLLSRVMMKKIDVVNVHGDNISWKVYKQIFGFIDKVYVVQTTYTACQDIQQKDRRKAIKYKPQNIQALVFPSLSIKDSYGKNIMVEKIYVIPQGNDIDLSAKFEQHQLTITKEIIGYGDICLENRIHTLIEAIRYLPKDYSVRWIGNGVTDNDYLREISDLAKNIGVENRIEIIIPKDENIDTNTLFYGVSLYIDISDGISFSYLIESLMRDIPVVSSKEILTEIQGYNYVSSIAPKSIAHAIKNAIESHESVDIKEISAEFSWQASAERYDEVYANSLKPIKNK